MGLFLVISAPDRLEAQEWTKNYKTQYAIIHYSNDNDLAIFTKNIDKGFSFSSESIENNPLLTKNRVDKIVERVRALLDMYPSGLYFSIYLYQTNKEIETMYRSMGFFDKAPIAFYSHRTKAIYISLESITDRIFAHETAHAVINFYFIIPPPARMQEILAQHVDRYLWEK